MKAVERSIANTIRKVVSAEASVWPPICHGIFYQPERPVASHKGNTAPSPRKKNK